MCFSVAQLLWNFSWYSSYTAMPCKLSKWFDNWKACYCLEWKFYNLGCCSLDSANFVEACLVYQYDSDNHDLLDLHYGWQNFDKEAMLRTQHARWKSCALYMYVGSPSLPVSRKLWAWLLSNLLYKMHQIQKLECFSSRLAVVFAQSSEVRRKVENEAAVGATPTGDAPTTSGWSTILLPTKVPIILEVWQ